MFRKEPKIDPNLHNDSIVFVQSIDLYEKLKLINYFNDFIKKYQQKPIHRYYFLNVRNAEEQYNMFLLLASWLLKKCGKHQANELIDRKNKHMLLEQILKSTDDMGLKINLNTSKLKEGAGKLVIEILDFLVDKVLEKCQFQWKKPKIINSGSISVDTIIEDNTLDKQNKNIESKSWYKEIEKVNDKLELEVIPESDNWRAHYEDLKKSQEKMQEILQPINSGVQQLITNLEICLEKFDNRERFLNDNFDQLLTEYRNYNDTYLNLKETNEKLEIKLTKKNQELSGINDEIKNFKEQLSLQDSLTIKESPIINIKKAINSMKSEIQEFDIRIDTLQMGLLQYRISERSELNFRQICLQTNKENIII